jgi:hypothetical protein
MATIPLPEPFASIPRESFLFGPSPIQYLPNITKALGGKVGIYAKREDCNSGLAFGGNKTRKLEYDLPILLSIILSSSFSFSFSLFILNFPGSSVNCDEKKSDVYQYQ